MNREDVLQMKPGRELNKLVGKTINASPEVEWWAMDKDEIGCYTSFSCEGEVLEWHKKITSNFPKHPYSTNGGHIVRKEIHNRYSTDVSAAYEIIDMLSKIYFGARSWNNKPYKYVRTTITHSKKGAKCCIQTDVHSFPAEGKTISEAICKAFLLSKL